MRLPLLALASTVALAGLTALPGTAYATVPVATTVTVTGSGFGHGVGLSQYGAFGQAKEGRSAEDILRYYYTGAQVAPIEDARPVAVNIAHAVPSLTLSAQALDATPGSGWSVGLDGVPETPLTLDTLVSVSGSGAALSVSINAPGVPPVVLTGSSLHVTWNGAVVVNAGSDRLRHGDLTVLPSRTGGGALGRIEAVTRLSLHDEYLYGLAEVPSSWPKEALRAQAIAARSYAYGAVAAKPGGIAGCGGCQVYDTDASQVFRGWTKESEVVGGTDYGALWRAAVDATTTDPGHGLAVVGAAGVPLRTYYFSSSGGRTRNSEDVWSASLPYARSVDDHWSLGADNPNARWTVALPAARVAAAFGLPGVSALTVTARDSGTAAATVQAVDGEGRVATLTGERFRTALGLRSSWISGLALDVPAAPAPVVTPPVPDPPTLSIVYRQPGPHVLRGRQWTTGCTTYSGTLRCVAQPYGTYYVANPSVRGGVLRKAGYQAAATSYTAKAAPLWDTNAYARPGTFRDSAGRAWTVTCNAPVGGPRLCVSTVHAKVLTAVRSGGKLHLVRKDMDLVRRYVRLTNA